MLCLVLLPALCAALPTTFKTEKVLQRNDTAAHCKSTKCFQATKKYQSISMTPPGFQWHDHGGYCGSWSIQRAVLAKGAWISQQQVREHALPAPGVPPSHGNEILSPNIDGALRNLKIRSQGFDYKNMPFPQQQAYFKWLKKQLVAGHTVVWMIMWNGARYPAYNLKLPAGLHGHVEPVIGIQSNHPLTDETVYDDDNVVHYSDNSNKKYYPAFGSLSGIWSGVGSKAECQHGISYCIGPYSYGWAVQGFLDEQEGTPLSLQISHFEEEPDVVEAQNPINLTGTLVATGLTVGLDYSIYRWGSVKDAFTYSDTFKIVTFTAAGDKFVFQDPHTFSSASATYYRCVKADLFILFF